MNLIFLFPFVRMIFPVNGIFLRIPGLCRMENLPKLFSFSVNPSVARWFSNVHSRHETTALTICSASFLVARQSAA